ncbi:MAG: GspE/PulE family protein [Deltaproteobacteria bacterium]|nr:MAG: GspE/PulE family protein [Deltaproteobacteria bacterium]
MRERGTVRAKGNLEERLKKEQLLKSITHKLHGARDLDEILLYIKNEIIALFDAERITVYGVDAENREIYSKVKEGDEVKEIRLALDKTSIAGHTAISGRRFNLANVYDRKELERVDPQLRFDGQWDQATGFETRQLLSAPSLYKGKYLKGVVQVINKRGADQFTQEDEQYLEEICRVLGLAFHNQSRMQRRPSRFDQLLNQQIISEEDLNQAITLARERNSDLASMLVNEYKVPKKALAKSFESYYGVPFVSYEDWIIIPTDLVKGLNLGYLRRNYWVPLQRENGKLIIVVDDPNNRERVKEIKALIKAEEYEFRVALREDILRFIDTAVGGHAGVTTVKSIIGELARESDESEEPEEEFLNESDAGIVRLANQIIKDAHDLGASDIHIEPYFGRQSTIIRFRRDGACFKYQEVPHTHTRPLVSRIKIMAKLDIAERRLPQSGKIKLRYGSKELELRVEVTPTVGGREDLVLRLLSSGKPFPLDRMNFSATNLKNLLELIEKPYGILLVVGPTGSGKTTTLHSVLGHINRPEVKIWTAEDPVEITQYGLRQVQTHAKIGYSFADAMRSFLRADPDVIMVGEMRDAETAQIGLEASLTGHLVFSTLHTNSAPETIIRLIDMGMNPLNFADALLGILAQRLVRTICPGCKEAYHPDRSEFDLLAQEYGMNLFEELEVHYDDEFLLHRGRGCEDCTGSGYRGRAGIHELLVASPKIKELIQNRAHMEEIRRVSMSEAMRTLKQDGIWKVLQGHTDYTQVRRVCIV